MGKERTLYYRRVKWSAVGPHNLQTYVDRVHRRLKTTALRTFVYNEGQIQGINFKHERKPGFSLIHVTYYVPRQPTSLVPEPAAVQLAETVECKPPAKHNYMEGDIFLLVKNNDVIICASGMREGTAKRYLVEVLEKCGIDEEFDLEQVANVDKVVMLSQEGVKRIRLGSSVFRASYDYVQRQTKKTELMGKLAAEVMRIFGKGQGDSLDDLKAYENLRVKLEISFDERRKGGQLAAESLAAAGCSMIDSDDKGFTIETMNGNKLTAEDIKVHQKVEIKEHGNSVACEHAWDAMRNYYEELDDAGVLEF